MSSFCDVRLKGVMVEDHIGPNTFYRRIWASCNVVMKDMISFESVCSPGVQTNACLNVGCHGLGS